MAVNITGLELTKAAELHGRVYVASNFYEEVINGPTKSERSPQFQKVLENLLELHLIQTFFRHLGDILRVSGKQDFFQRLVGFLNIFSKVRKGDIRAALESCCRFSLSFDINMP